MNLIEAIYNLHHLDDRLMLDARTFSSNKANQMGEGLEAFIKDMFSNTFNVSHQERLSRQEEVFSYAGNTNNPPDFILRGAAAFEVKKQEGRNYNHLQLNSSYPRSRLYADDPKITNACRSCENWREKDNFYVIGHSERDGKSKLLKELWIIDGTCYAADRNTYLRYSDAISGVVLGMPDIEFTKTKELAKVNKVDPLGITSLRVRGMWLIDHPRNVFNNLTFDSHSGFNLYCIVREDVYYGTPESSRSKLQTIPRRNLNIVEERVKDPNNTARTVKVKFLHYER